MNPFKKLFASNTVKPDIGKLLAEITTETEGGNLDDFFENPNEDFLLDLNVDDLVTTVKKMLYDEQVSAELDTFKSFVTRTSYMVAGREDDTNEELLDFYNSVISKDGNAFLKMVYLSFLDALDYGCVICEVVWEDPALNDGLLLPKRLKPLSHTRYGFNKRGEIVDLFSQEVLNDPYKYLAVSHNIRDGNLNGNSLVLRVYWAWFFRKAIIKAGVLYAKKAIIPSIVALFKGAENTALTKTRGETITAELKKLTNSSGIALSNVDKIDTVNPTSKGDDVINLIEIFNRMISKGILGTATLTNDTTYSNRGDSANQETIVKGRAQKVATEELESPINTLLRWITELNKGLIDKDKLPRFKYIYEYDPSFAETITAVQTQIPVSASWFYEKYNVKAPDETEGEADILIKPNTVTVPPENLSSFFLRQKHQRNK